MGGSNAGRGGGDEVKESEMTTAQEDAFVARGLVILNRILEEKRAVDAIQNIGLYTAQKIASIVSEWIGLAMISTTQPDEHYVMDRDKFKALIEWLQELPKA